ncbi:MAG: DUF533 domain-containing protein [Deltaproteobacteria bacterium]|nr:DUF533 domain-containing protein [Deltaproteobacteria bacterium]
MFNAEQLLGKMMAEMVVGSGGGGALRALTSTLLSGQGLMTAVGLGVGAYEILKSQQGATPPPPHFMPPPPAASPGSGAPLAAAAMPSVPPPLPGALVNPLQDKKDSSAQGEELALRLIQVMIAAAHADGGMDSDEEAKILARLQGQGLSQEERRFILTEMHDPKSIEQLVTGINDPRIAQTMYSLAVSAVVVDTAEERAWLDRLATALSISEGMRRFIEAEE